jgi:hypothetical protein
MALESEKRKWSTKEVMFAISFVCTILIQTLYLKFSLEIAIREEINNRIADVRVLEEKIKNLEKGLSENKELPVKKNNIFENNVLAIKPDYSLKIETNVKRKKHIG